MGPMRARDSSARPLGSIRGFANRLGVWDGLRPLYFSPRRCRVFGREIPPSAFCRARDRSIRARNRGWVLRVGRARSFEIPEPRESQASQTWPRPHPPDTDHHRERGSGDVGRRVADDSNPVHGYPRPADPLNLVGIRLSAPAGPRGAHPLTLTPDVSDRPESRPRTKEKAEKPIRSVRALSASSAVKRPGLACWLRGCPRVHRGSSASPV